MGNLYSHSLLCNGIVVVFQLSPDPNHRVHELDILVITMIITTENMEKGKTKEHIQWILEKATHPKRCHTLGL